MKRSIKSLLKTFGYELSQTSNTQFFVFERLLNFLMQRRGKLRFIQVGACDGISNDPLYPYIRCHPQKVEGIVIEPLPDLYLKLQKNYHHFPNVEAVNLAIHNELQTLMLYRVKPEKLSELPESALGITSFDPQHHRPLGIPDEYMQQVTVPCKRLIDVAREKNLLDIDLLLIDTEGYDFELLQGIDFSQFKPNIIRFEHSLNTTDRYALDFLKIVPILHAAGYEMIHHNSDCIAYQQDMTLQKT